MTQPVGNKVTVNDLGSHFYQHRMKCSFKDTRFDSNVAYTSLEDCLKAAIEKAKHMAMHDINDFLPVHQAIVNGEIVGLIGAIRFFKGYLEFSYFEPSNRDYNFRKFHHNWEIAALKILNSQTKTNPDHPYYYNLTSVACDNLLDKEKVNQATKMLTRALS